MYSPINRQTRTCPCPALTRSYVVSWGRRSAKNWTLCSTWDSELWNLLDSHPSMSKVDLLAKLNDVATVNFLEYMGWKPLKDTSFIVVKVIQEDAEKGYDPASQVTTIDVQQILLKEDNLGYAGISTVNLQPMKVVARGCLAQILQGTVNYQDILILFGGLDDFFVGESEKSTISDSWMNYNDDFQTAILRIADMPENQCERVILFEKIRPLWMDTRFQFTYMSRHSSFRRVIEKRREFDDQIFCDVRNTLAYSINRWDFPVPVSKGTQCVTAVYRLLSSPNFRMFTSYNSPSTSFEGKASDTSFDKDHLWQYSTPLSSFSKRQKQQQDSSLIYPSKKLPYRQCKTRMPRKLPKKRYICHMLVTCFKYIAILLGLTLTLTWVYTDCKTFENWKKDCQY